jgi:hypothetical protein
VNGSDSGAGHTRNLSFSHFPACRRAFWQVILRMRKITLRKGSGERARNLLRDRKALAGCRGGEP